MPEPEHSLWIPGRPRPAPRPRRAAGGHFYIPDSGYQGEVAAAWLQKFGRVPLDGPVRLTLCFSFEKGKEGCYVQVVPTENADTEYRASKPDLDNLSKSILDSLGGHVLSRKALGGLAWKDDSQVVHITAWKVDKLQEERP